MRPHLILTTLIAIFIVSISLPVSANPLISEIMYDAQGSDTNREWIEVFNDQTSAINLSNWKLIEAGSQHTITPYQGSDLIAGKGYVIIADDPTSFLIDYPNFNGTLFDSTFSLLNTGEYLAISNGTQIINQLNYSNSWGGFNGSTIELKNKSSDNSLAVNWNSSLILGGTPGQQNSIEPQEEEQEPCIPVLQNTSWTDWVNATACQVTDTYVQQRTRVQFDSANCGTILNGTYSETRSLSCDFCTPLWSTRNSSCAQNDSITRYDLDLNSCHAQTNLSSDLQGQTGNVTYPFACDFNDDGLIGNISDIQTTLPLQLLQNSSTILLYEGGNFLLEIFRSSLAISLSLPSLFIEREENGTGLGYTLVHGLPQNTNKTIYVSHFSNSQELCLDDSPISNISQVSAGCTEENETKIYCDGTLQQGYSCELLGDRFKIQGLHHSAALELSNPPPQDTDDDTNSQTNSGGGGGGGGGGRNNREILRPQSSTQTESSQESTISNITTSASSDENIAVVEKEIEVSFQDQTASGSKISKQLAPTRIFSKNQLTGAAGLTAAGQETATSSTTQKIVLGILGLVVVSSAIVWMVFGRK